MPKLLEFCHWDFGAPHLFFYLGGKTGTNGPRIKIILQTSLNATESKGTVSISTHTGQLRQRLSFSYGLIYHQFKCCFVIPNKALEVISCEHISLK